MVLKHHCRPNLYMHHLPPSIQQGQLHQITHKLTFSEGISLAGVAAVRPPSPPQPKAKRSTSPQVPAPRAQASRPPFPNRPSLTRCSCQSHSQSSNSVHRWARIEKRLLAPLLWIKRRKSSCRSRQSRQHRSVEGEMGQGECRLRSSCRRHRWGFVHHLRRSLEWIILLIIRALPRLIIHIYRNSCSKHLPHVISPTRTLSKTDSCLSTPLKSTSKTT